MSRDPKEAASFHCDKHVCKMIIESAQMLSTVHWHFLLNYNGKEMSDFKRVKDAKQWLAKATPKLHQPPYMLTHYNHPCNIWARKSIENYMWLSNHGLHLCNEYTERYGKIHKTQRVHEWLNKHVPVGILSSSLSEHPVCMPDDCKISNDAVECYRRYYAVHKSRFAKWKATPEPSWFSEQVNLVFPTRDTSHI